MHWFGVGKVQGERACELRRLAWQRSRNCTTHKRITASTTCTTPKPLLPKADSHPFRAHRAFMRPAPFKCATRDQSRQSATCARFVALHWQPWQAMLSDTGRTMPCVSYASEFSGIGNWLPTLLDAARTAAEARMPLKVNLRGSQAFWAMLGVQLGSQPPSCLASNDSSSSKSSIKSSSSNYLEARRSWIYDPVQGTTGPNPREGGADLLGCIFALFTCPNETVVEQVAKLRARLPRSFVAAHARLAHQAAGQEARLLATLNHLYETSPASHWKASANRSLPLGQRLAPWDRLLTPALPAICRAVCEARGQSAERMLPSPFLCCGRRDFELFGDAIEARSRGELAYLTTDLAAFQRFTQRYLPDIFVQEPGTALHSGRWAETLGRIASASDEESAARKTAADFLMLVQGQQLVVLNPSTFSAVAAGLHQPTGTVPIHATGRMTCGLRRGRPCRR